MCRIKTVKGIDVEKLKQQDILEILNKGLNVIDFDETRIKLKKHLYTTIAK